MAKVWGQNVPTAIYDWYTRILGVQRSTGFNYWEGFYGYSYGGLVGKRIPFHMRRWQHKHASYIPIKRRNVQEKFKRAVWIWWNQLYGYGAGWTGIGPKPRTLWAEKAHENYWQYFRFFIYYSMPGLLRDEILDWQKCLNFEEFVFDDAYFA